jgi:hypothetical protein
MKFILASRTTFRSHNEAHLGTIAVPRLKGAVEATFRAGSAERKQMEAQRNINKINSVVKFNEK